MKLDIVNNSIEINKNISDDTITVLFTYKIGCIGDLAPVTVKYFAYRNGVKYLLRGEAHIIIENDNDGGEKPPVPDLNLKDNTPPLEFMLNKWSYVSTTKIN